MISFWIGTEMDSVHFFFFFLLILKVCKQFGLKNY